MAYELVPGPCPDAGCPAPSQIDCLEVTRVYDFCYDNDVHDSVFFDVPAACGPIPEGSTAAVTVTAVEPSVRQVAAIPAAQGFANATLLVRVRLGIAIAAPDGRLHARLVGEFHYTRTVTLCAPPGATVRCSAPQSVAGPAAVVGRELCTRVSIALLFESSARVKLLVPTYGPCPPAPCVVLADPPFPMRTPVQASSLRPAGPAP